MSDTRRHLQRKVRMSGPERRQQLVAVARAVFAERGYAAASIEEIAERADVSKPVVYEHFGGKEGIYSAVVDRDLAALRDQVLQALDASHPRAMLEQAVDAFLAYIDENPQGFRILMRDAPAGLSSGSLSSVMGEIAQSAEELLAAQFQERGYQVAMAPLYAGALVGMVAFVGQRWLAARTPERGVVAAHLVNLAWHGLRDLDPAPRVADGTAR